MMTINRLRGHLGRITAGLTVLGAILGLASTLEAQTTWSGDQFISGNLNVAEAISGSTISVTGSTSLGGDVGVGGHLGVGAPSLGIGYDFGVPSVFLSPQPYWNIVTGLHDGDNNGTYSVAFFGSLDPGTPLGMLVKMDYGSRSVYLQGTVIGRSGANLNLQPEAGNVGIGTSTPAYLLDVAGDAGIEGDISVVGNASIGGVVSLAPGGDIPMYSGT